MDKIKEVVFLKRTGEYINFKKKEVGIPRELKDGDILVLHTRDSNAALFKIRLIDDNYIYTDQLQVVNRFDIPQEEESQ